MKLREAGEHVVRYVIRKDPRTDSWKGSLQARSGSVGADGQPWVEWPSRTYTSAGVGLSTVQKGVDQTIELMRMRVGQDVSNSNNIPDPAPGFMIWLEPQ